jgi:hypothetical protein
MGFTPKKSHMAVGLVVAAIGSTLAFGAIAASAHPILSDKVGCLLAPSTPVTPTGVAGPLNPPIPLVAATNKPTDVTDGNYAFKGSATCVQAFDSEALTAGGSDGGGVFTVHIESAGYYTNDFVVGNGNVAGTAGLCETSTPATSEVGTGCSNILAGGTPGPAAPGPDPTWYVPVGASGSVANDWTSVGYGIDFTGGVGTLAGGMVTPPDSASGVPETNPVKSSNGSFAHNPDAWNVGGLVDIAPLDVHMCPNAVAGNPTPPNDCVYSFVVNGGFGAES